MLLGFLSSVSSKFYKCPHNNSNFLMYFVSCDLSLEKCFQWPWSTTTLIEFNFSSFYIHIHIHIRKYVHACIHTYILTYTSMCVRVYSPYRSQDSLTKGGGQIDTTCTLTVLFLKTLPFHFHILLSLSTPRLILILIFFYLEPWHAKILITRVRVSVGSLSVVFGSGTYTVEFIQEYELTMISSMK